MKQKTLFALWGGMFILCAILGFIPASAGAGRWLRTAAAVLCFLPPLRLFSNACKNGDTQLLRLLRNLAGASLAVTVLLIAANFAAFAASEAVGNFLYVLLVILSSPMICGGTWVLSLFLWACLLVACLKELKK